MGQYLYYCNKCKKEIVIEHSIKIAPLKEHPECGSTLKRIFREVPGIVFKGDGWKRPSTKSTRKVDNALKKMGIQDESNGWGRRED